MNTDSHFHQVAEASSISPGTGRTVHVNGREFAVYNVDGEFYAIDDICPHKGASLGGGFAMGCHVFCPLHAWEFDLKTGECLNNRTKEVKTYPTRVIDGWVEIQVES